MDAVLLFYIFHMVNCVYFCRGPLAGGKKKGGGDVIKSERKKVTIITEAKSFF